MNLSCFSDRQERSFSVRIHPAEGFSRHGCCRMSFDWPIFFFFKKKQFSFPPLLFSFELYSTAPLHSPSNQVRKRISNDRFSADGLLDPHHSVCSHHVGFKKSLFTTRSKRRCPPSGPSWFEPTWIRPWTVCEASCPQPSFRIDPKSRASRVCLADAPTVWACGFQTARSVGGSRRGFQKNRAHLVQTSGRPHPSSGIQVSRGGWGEKRRPSVTEASDWNHHPLFFWIFMKAHRAGRQHGRLHSSCQCRHPTHMRLSEVRLCWRSLWDGQSCGISCHPLWIWTGGQKRKEDGKRAIMMKSSQLQIFADLFF